MAKSIRSDSLAEGEGVSPEYMKPIAQLKMTWMVIGLVAVHALEAADVSTPGAQAPVSDRGAVRMPEPQLPDAKAAVDLPVPDIKLPPGVELPKSVKDLEANFRAQAQAYVERQKVLSQRAETATASERERIREQIKVNRAQFLQQTKQIRSEIKDRIREVHRSISRPLDGASGERSSGAKRRR
ncbi:MAG: hypothetical protein KIT22_10225 [Verrucomicrobiae bacterium]|nr:hypothetical protein [Verrucomicrobiae bacterium]